MRLILLGPPGAGKGTQAQVFIENWQLTHISTGDIFRRLIKEKTPLGLKIKQYVTSGGLVPDEIVVEVVVQKMNELGREANFVLDGFPRTLIQATILDKKLIELDISIDKVLYFNASEDVIIERLSGRRICKECGATYHIVNIPPKKEGICDQCGGNLYQREDDKPETVRNRLKVYHQQTAELIEYYKKKCLLETLNSDLSKDETFKVVKKILGVGSPS